jgi:uncharacterized protein
MDITPSIVRDRQIIESYGAGRFRISGADYRGSVIITAEWTRPWAITDMSGLSVESLADIVAAEPPVEILLLGCGTRLHPLPAPFRAALREHGMSCDSMDTGAACRTFNVLITEARRVAAALIALPDENP